MKLTAVQKNDIVKRVRACRYKTQAEALHAAVQLAEEALAVERPAGEPVAAQCRFPGVGWSQCDVAHAQLVLESPGEWPRYEVRLLYTAPPAAARVPLTPAQQHADELLEALKAMNAGCRDPHLIGLLLSYDMARDVLAKITAVSQEGGAA